MRDLLPKFKDIKRIKQDAGPNPVINVAYSRNFEEVMDYFRAVLQMEPPEYSERTLALTAKVLKYNSANFSAWQFRRDCLREMKESLDEELKWSRDYVFDSPKNYQVWFHLRTIVRWIGEMEPEKKMEVLAKEKDHNREMLRTENKNYHAWAYRLWLVMTYEDWQDELEFVETHLKKDIRNNSAWSYRFNLIEHSVGWSKQEIIIREMEFAVDNLSKCIDNDAGWNFLLGIIALPKFKLWENCKVVVDKIIAENTFKSIQEQAKPKAFLVELLSQFPDPQGTGLLREQASNICDDLAQVFDRPRKPYWLWRKAALVVTE